MSGNGKDPGKRDLETQKQRCLANKYCKAITCAKGPDLTQCTLRAGDKLLPGSEVTFLHKDEHRPVDRSGIRLRFSNNFRHD